MEPIRKLWQRIMRVMRGEADAATAHGRGRLRLRRAAWSGISNSAASACALAVAFISVPLILRHIGAAEYGVWITLSSVLTWLAMTDAGLAGPALVNALSDAQGRRDVDAARSIISTAFFSLCGLALLMGALLALCFPLIPWRAVFDAPGSLSTASLHQACAWALACFVISFPAGMASAVYTGLQQGYIAHAWSVLAHLGSLVALWVVLSIDLHLPGIVLAYSGVRLAVLGLALAYLFGVHRPDLRPHPRHLSRHAFSRLFALGWKYLLQQLANLGLFHSQPMLLTQLAGPTAVAIYSVTQRLFSLPPQFVQFFVMPLLPAYGEARAAGDVDWIRRTVRRSLLASASIGLCGTLLLAATAEVVIAWWASPVLIPPGSLTAALAGYALANSIASPLAVFLSGLERIGFLAGVAGANAVATVGLALGWIPLYGVTGMGAAMCASFVVINLGSLLLASRRAWSAAASGVSPC